MIDKENIKLLQRLLSKMDLPIQRKTQTTPHNFKWLLKNMGKRNSHLPEYQEAKNILIKLLGE